MSIDRYKVFDTPQGPVVRFKRIPYYIFFRYRSMNGDNESKMEYWKHIAKRPCDKMSEWGKIRERYQNLNGRLSEVKARISPKWKFSARIRATGIDIDMPIHDRYADKKTRYMPNYGEKPKISYKILIG